MYCQIDEILELSIGLCAYRLLKWARYPHVVLERSSGSISLCILI